ncbi:RagB/SusD family nutrient uptake outer membrane protein [Chryseobacterium sp. KBW03]|uniref:RagB/SusD family nutrient uptake outer membrane protein n=1 Tax=Chryseobacterium sp. KBW03 TaxID=2153362 RepID=UPI000F5ACF2F|nr:RagB/SusD family nutrient uptake outer membrane protein [Chryseobacterium sp. KBW03]RQO37656.1 RagB/SusD family nutrient uptake outer membrane protein [Chryseobacterium sp. KBW03]
MKTFTLIIFISLTFVSCRKQDEWLDKKSSKSDVVPTTLDDYQAILDNTEIMNTYYPSLGLVGSDNYLITDASWNGMRDIAVKNMYAWAKDIYEGSTTGSIWEWSKPYEIVEYSNVVLEGIDKINISDVNRAQWNNIKGSALFYRAYAFYNLAQLFCKPFDPLTSDSDLGIPLRLNSDVNIKSTRATVKQTYDQIINDLLIAESLLSETPLYKTRPSIPAIKALLAKSYLLMDDYENALKYAEMALNYNNILIDYNTLNTSTTYSLPNFKTGNPEVIFYATATSYSVVMSRATQIVSPDLYNSYLGDDLRKKVFYRGTIPSISFTGHQNGSNNVFAGLANNELFLLKAECQIRLGNLNSGLGTLKDLLTKRWNKNITFSLPTITNEKDALKFILSERRKELPFTSNTRWEDLRRFNTDSRFAQTLTRTINGELYSLPPNDPRYVFPIPPLEILKSNIEQNIR